MPPKAATDVAVAALTLLPELDVLELLPVELLPQPAANIRPPTAMAAATVLVLGTCSPSGLRGHKARMRAPMARTGESSR